MNALLINDVHIGVSRSAGTTQASRRALREYLQTSMRDLIFDHLDKDLIVNGDLFDSFSVDVMDVLFCYYTFSDWLFQSIRKRGHIQTVRLVLGRGNHDIAKDNSKLSSFDFLGSLLTKQFPDNVQVVTGGLTELDEHVWMIPHVANQDLFNMELDKALDIHPSHILLHANVDNQYADQSDHSLNVDADRINQLIERGHTLVFAHEHHHKTMYRGGVIVTGNQWPSSIYDCLTQGRAQSDGAKYAHIISETTDHKGVTKVSLDRVKTWDATGSYMEIPWGSLMDMNVYQKAQFVRVSGDAIAEQAADVMSAIANFRNKSDAFVVSNMVKVAGAEGLDDLPELTQEKLQAVDILAALKAELDPEECAVVDSLLEGINNK